MKKTIIILAALGMTFPGIGQEKYVVSALTALKGNNLEEAKTDIDKAMASPETSEKPKTLFAKAQIYFTMQQSDKYKASNPYKEGTQALYKLSEVKPDYERATADQLLLISAYLYYNEGAKAYNDKKLSDAADDMKNVIKIHDMDGGKRFEKSQFTKQFDTVSAQAKMTLANSAYYLGKYDEAIPLLVSVKNNPISRSPSIYECLIDAYNKEKNTSEAYATIEEARKAFPEDVTIRNYELNYYITSGKQDELVKKLEDAVAKSPNDDVLLFNLATTYLEMAKGKDGKKPANSADLVAKSEDAFQRALKIAPDNAGYNYNFGALYYNRATDFNDQMNAITGTSDADQKKYDAMKAQRDAEFAKSEPYFEKAYDVLSTNEANLKGEDKTTYRSTLLALKEVYARQNKMDKSLEMKRKYESLK